MQSVLDLTVLMWMELWSKEKWVHKVIMKCLRKNYALQLVKTQATEEKTSIKYL